MVVQIHGGKNPVLGEEIVTQGDLIEEVVLGNLPLLLETVEQEGDLGLKGILFPIPIELGKERILFRFLQDQSRIKLFCHKSGQARFAYADRPLDHDILKHHPSPSSSRPPFGKKGRRGKSVSSREREVVL